MHRNYYPTISENVAKHYMYKANDLMINHDNYCFRGLTKHQVQYEIFRQALVIISAKKKRGSEEILISKKMIELTDSSVPQRQQ